MWGVLRCTDTSWEIVTQPCTFIVHIKWISCPRSKLLWPHWDRSFSHIIDEIDISTKRTMIYGYKIFLLNSQLTRFVLFTFFCSNQSFEWSHYDACGEVLNKFSINISHQVEVSPSIYSYIQYKVLCKHLSCTSEVLLYKVAEVVGHAPYIKKPPKPVRVEKALTAQFSRYGGR